MKKLIPFLIFLLSGMQAFSQFINVSGITATGRFASCAQQIPALNVTAELINLNGGAVVNNGVFTCNNGCDSSTVRVTMSNVRWNQVPNAEWLHGLFLPANAGFVVSAVAIPAGFITYNPGCVGMCPSGSGFNGGPGFYFDNTAGNTCCGVIGANDGLPCNNFGDVAITCNNLFTLVFDIKFCNSIITNNSYTFVLHGSSDGETGCWNFNDLLAHNMQFTIATNPCAPPAINPTAAAPVRTCVGGNVNYTATLTGVCNNNVSWWDDPVAGNLVGTGSPFVYDPAGPACPAGVTLYATCCTGNIAGCLSRVPVTIPGTCDVLTITNVAVTNATCLALGSINATTVINAVGVVNFNLNPGNYNNVTGIFTGLNQTQYTLTATDATGCTATTVVNVAQPPPIVFSNPVITGTTCALPNSGQIVISASGGTGPLVLTISPFAVQAPPGTFSGLSAQAYTITATDSLNCTVSTVINITNSPPVNWVSVSHTDALCNGSNDGTITAQAGGGLAPFSYTLMPGGANNNTGNFTGLSPNSYTVTAVDINGCSNSTVIVINNPTPVGWTLFTSVNVLCANGNTGNITVLVGGGTPGYVYNLMPGNINSVTGIFNGLLTGTYTVTATDINGCSITSTVTITQPPVINYVTTTATAAICNGANTGSISVVASGGNGVLTYTLNPGNISNLTGIFPNLVAGNYTITTTDANNCTLTTVINVNQPVPITFPSVVTGSPTCAGLLNGSLSVVAAGGAGLITYTLNPLGTVNITGNFSGLAAGTYTVLATDANGCSATTIVVIAPPVTITFPTATFTPVICNGQLNGTITVAAAGGAGGFSYLLQPGGLLSNTGLYTGLAAGVYTVTGIDANNCSNTTVITITQPATLIWNAVTPVNVSCNGANNGSINANALGGVGAITYNLQPGALTNLTGIFTNLAGNIYTLTATDANGCSISTVINIIDPGVLTISNVNIVPPNCVPGNNGIITVTVAGGTAPFNYNIGAGNQLSNVFNNVGQGTYTITVTDANNCTATSVITVITPNSPLFTNVVVQNVNCFGGGNGSIIAQATGGNGLITYTFQPGNIVNNTGVFPNLPVGTYTITAVDVNNCSTQTIINITSPVMIIIDSVIHQDILCNNGQLGSINAYAHGGVGQLTYTLQPGNITNLTGAFPNLQVGNYVVTITDANGCFVTASVNIILLPIMQWDTVSYSTIFCAGGNSGYIFANVTGGVAPITYTLQPGNVINLTGYFTNLAAGIYVVTATDVNGCTTILSINLTQPSPIVITNVVNSLISCVPGNDGTITVTATGGVQPYTYTKSGVPQPGNVFTGVGAGIYLITVTDVNGCTATVFDTLLLPVPPVLNLLSVTQVTCNNDVDGAINVSATGGVGALTYQLMPGNVTNGSGIFTNLAGGTYTITVTDILNCTSSLVVTVVNPAPVTITNIAITEPLCTGNANGTITVSATGGTGFFTCLLNPGGISNITGLFTNLGIGTYTITVSDINNCTASTIVVMTQPLPVIWNNATFVSPTCNGLIDGSISVNAGGGVGAFSYTLLPNGTVNNSGVFTNINAGTYTVNATDANGCSISTVIIVTQPPVLNIANIATTPPSCIPGNDGTVTITVNGGTGPYNYNIGAGNQLSNLFTGIGGGTYTITVTDANNCTLTNVVSLTNPGAPVVSNVTPVNATCNGSNDGGITIITSGGTPPITYTLLPGGAFNNTGIFTGLAAITYTINVSDANGCTTVATATINAPNSMIFSTLNNTSVSCFGGSDASITAIVTGGTGTITYVLQPGNVTNITGVFNNLPAGVYTITATDVNGCNTVSTTTIIQPAQLVWGNIVIGNVSCNNGNDGNIAVTTSGGTGTVTYTLLPNNITNISGTFSNLAFGTFTVQAVDANGCSISTTVIITQTTPVVISSIVSTVPTCSPGNDATVTVLANGGLLPYNYNIGFGNQLSNIFTNVGAGNYTITITDANGCSATSAFAVSNPASPLITNVTLNNVLCFGGNNATATVTATGGVGALSYTLMPNNITNLTGIFLNLTAGVYTVNVSDASNCTASSLITITQPNALAIGSVVTTNILCAGAADGNVTVTTVGGTGTVDFTILPGNITNQTGYFNNLAAGIYTMTCTDANGCTVSTTFSITVPPALTIGVPSVNNVLCYNGNDGNVSVTASGGTGNISYTLLPVNLTNNTGYFNSLATGNYTIVATDANGCTVSTIFTITQPPPTQLVNYTTITPSCIPGNDGSITVNVSGGLPPYQYSINGGAPQLSNTFTNLAAGTYTILVADVNDCKVILVVTLANSMAPVFTTVTVTPETCFGIANGNIDVVATGGNGLITYTILPNNISNITGLFPNLIAGTYTINAVDANGCSVSTIAIVTSPAQLVLASISSTNITCNGGTNGSITAVVTGGQGAINYNLQPGNLNNLTGLFTGLAVNVYTLTATDANGCTVSTTVNITQPTPVIWANITQTDVSCNGGNNGAITVLATGGGAPMDYNIQPGNITNQTGIFANLTAGIYTIIAADVVGCSITTTVTINQPLPLLITNVTNTTPTCVPGNDGTINITGSGGVAVYNYNIGGANQLGNVFTNIGIGNYTITITDANNCTVTSVYAVTAPNAPSFTNAVSTPVTCNGGNDASITVTATGGAGGINYTLLPNNITNASGIFPNLTAGIYTINAVDASNCSVSTTLQITEPAALIWTTFSYTNVTCNGGTNATITALVTGGVGIINYNLQPGNQNNQTGLYTGLVANIYTLTATDANGCILSTIINITQPTQVVWVSATSTATSCNGGVDGTVTVLATGGGAPMDYNIMPGNITNQTGQFNNLAAGIYTIIAADVVGCSITTTVTVNQPTPVLISSITNTTPSCVPGNDGTLTITATGGTPGYQYNIGGANQPANVFTNIGTGNYTVTVTDANGCTVSSIYIVTAPNAPSFTNAINTPVTCNGGNDGSLTVTATGGAGGINYTLLPNNITNASGIFTNLTAGIYTINAVDASNCSVSTTVQINEPTAVIWSAVSSTNVSCNGGIDATISVTATGGVGIISYTLQPGNQNNQTGNFTGLTAAVYTVTATDANGCVLTTTITISEPTPLVWTATAQTNVSCNGGNDGTITVSASGGTGIIDYNLQAGNITNQTGLFAALIAGTYTLTATDANGCSITTTLSITEPTPLQITNVTNTTPTCIPGNDGTITITATGGTPGYQYNIGGANQPGNFFNNIGTGNYTITVTDANNCTVTSVYNVVAPNVPVISNIVTTTASCVPGCDGSATLTATAGLPPYTYSIDGVNFQVATLFSSLCTGIYTATVKDANGCSSTSVFNIITSSGPVITNTAFVDILCNGGNNGSITIQTTGGTGTINYTLQPNNITNITGNFANLIAGIYTVFIVDANGCGVNTVVTISEPPVLQFVNIVANGALCNGAQNGTIDVTTTGGTGIIVYSITPLANFVPPATFNNLVGNTTYTVVATDANGCSISTAVFIFQPPALVIDSSFFTNITCNNFNDGTINVYASGGTGLLNYNLMPGAVNNNTGAFTGLLPGAYTVTVTDANNCSLSTTFSIIQPPPITLLSINATNVSCNNAQNATITIACTGGTGVLNYNLQPTNTNNNTGLFINLGGGTYTITVTDANNCSYTTSIAVVNPPILSFGTFIVTNISCFGNNDGMINAVAVGGTGTLTYVLQPGNVINNTGTYTGLIPGTYTVSVSDANLCSTSSVTTITEPLPLNINLVSTQNVICHGGNSGAIVVNANGGTMPYTFVLNPTGVSNNNGDFQNVTAGTYTVIVTDSNGCTNSVQNIVILEPPAIIFTAVSHVDVICYGDSTGSITVQASGGTGNIVYSITPALGTQFPLGFFAHLPSSIYTVTATDASNCTLTTIIDVKQNNEIIITELTWREPICYGDANGMINFTAVGGVAPLTYHLDNNVGQATGYFNNIIGGYHLLTITDVMGCRRDSLFLLPQPEPVHAGSLTIRPESCKDAKDGQIKVVGAGGRGGYTYYIRPGLHVNKSGLFYGFEEGTYTLTIKDTSLCEWDTIITVSPPINQLNIFMTKKDLGCYGTGIEGWAQANVSGGLSPYTYSWNTNPTQVTDRAVDLFFGHYIVEVVDANGCKIIDTVYIEPGPCCEEVFIPNAFSPNGDGNNDVFRMTTATGIELIQFDVYDRWGVRVWGTNNFRAAWDGTYINTGKDANVNTYYYIMRYICMTDGKTYTKKGDINLIR